MSGGEPSLRNDLPDIITLGRDQGFTYIQLNTNGRRLAREPGYGALLKEAGLSSVFLQFDGLTDEVNLKLRGRALLAEKLEAVKACADCGLGLILVPTLVPGINLDQVGDILRLALDQAPAVRGGPFPARQLFRPLPLAAAGRGPPDPAGSIKGH